MLSHHHQTFRSASFSSWGLTYLFCLRFRVHASYFMLRVDNMSLPFAVIFESVIYLCLSYLSWPSSSLLRLRFRPSSFLFSIFMLRSRLCTRTSSFMPLNIVPALPRASSPCLVSALSLRFLSFAFSHCLCLSLSPSPFPFAGIFIRASYW